MNVSTEGPSGASRSERGADDPVLPDQSGDDRDVGWGDDLRDRESDPDDVRRFLEERPPHHGD